jgi:CRISPR-associated protein Csb1
VPDQLTLDGLRNAVKGTAAAFRCRSKLRPVGDGDKVFPPTYAGGVYAVEDRQIEGRIARCVLLDSVQSQANRMEEVLQDAFLPNWRELPTDAETPCGLPIVAVHVNRHGWITSLTAPHRIHDAIIRDSNVSNGTRFRDSAIGAEIVGARLHNAAAFYKYCPTALIFGTWDSTGGGGLDSAKIPRAVVSEIVGVDYTAGVQTSSRLDPLGIKRESATIYRRIDGGWALRETDEGPWVGAQPDDLEKDATGNPKKFGKGKPSDINHGNVTPDLNRFGDRRDVSNKHLDQLLDILKSEPANPTAIKAFAVRPGGVTIDHALHTWTLSVTQLRRLRFPVDENHDEDRNTRVRTVLAALAIYALALQRERGYWLRSRCELIPDIGAELTQLNTDGSDSSFDVPKVKIARLLLDHALGDAAIKWQPTVIRLTPTAQLRRLVELSDELSPGELEEVQVSDAGDQD